MHGRTTVLLIGDDTPARGALHAGYAGADFDVLEARSGRDAVRLTQHCTPDLIVIDLDATDGHGPEMLRSIRAWSGAPVIVLAHASGQQDRIAAFENGADHYVHKPFTMPELLAQSRAALRRVAAREADKQVLTIGSLTIETASRRVLLDGKLLNLTRKEFSVLHALARNAGRVVTHQRVLQEVWGPRHVDDTHYLRIVMQRLRRKIEADATAPCRIVTQAGIGYRLVEQSARDSDTRLLADPAAP